jgi:hypothetical protein
MFDALATAYFARPEARAASRHYYRDLCTAIKAGGHQVEAVVMDAMDQSVALWESLDEI